MLSDKEKGIKFCEQSFLKTVDFDERWKMEVLREKIFKEIGKIINGIIFTH